MKASPFILMTFLSAGLALPATASPISVAEESNDPPPSVPPLPWPLPPLFDGDCGGFLQRDQIGSIDNPVHQWMPVVSDRHCGIYNAHEGYARIDISPYQDGIESRSIMSIAEGENMGDVETELVTLPGARYKIDKKTFEIFDGFNTGDGSWEHLALYVPPSEGAALPSKQIEISWDIEMYAGVEICCRPPCGDDGSGMGYAYASAELNMDFGGRLPCGPMSRWYNHGNSSMLSQWLQSEGSYSSQQGNYSVDGSITVGTSVGGGAGGSWSVGGETKTFGRTARLHNIGVRPLCIPVGEVPFWIKLTASTSVSTWAGLLHGTWTESEARAKKKKLFVEDAGCKDCCPNGIGQPPVENP